MARSAAARVFAVTELLEAILLHVESMRCADWYVRYEGDDWYARLVQDLEHSSPISQLFALQRVSRDFQATIVGSQLLQRKLTLIEHPSCQNRVSLDYFISHQHQKISTAWQNAEAGGRESWRIIKVNEPDTETPFIITHVWNASGDFPEHGFWDGTTLAIDVETYRTDMNTTLGALLNWKLGIESRKIAEMRAKAAARRRKGLERLADRLMPLVFTVRYDCLARTDKRVLPSITCGPMVGPFKSRIYFLVASSKFLAPLYQNTTVAPHSRTMATLSAAARVFRIPELLEAILLNLETSDVNACDQKNPCASDACKFNPFSFDLHVELTNSDAPPPSPPVLQLFVLQRVNQDFQATIAGSKALQRSLTVSSSIEMYARCYPSRSQVMLQSFIGVMNKRIRNAWYAASCSKPDRGGGESWKSIKINNPDSKDCVKIATVPKERFHIWELQTKPDTTLGELLDWKLGIEAQALEEQREIVRAQFMELHKRTRVDLT